jgi:plastocyanin
MANSMNTKATAAIAITLIAVLGLILTVPAFSSRAVASSTEASSTSKDFYIFTTEVEGVNETKLGLSGDIYSLQTMVVNQGDHVTVHFYNLETDKGEMHSFTIGAPYNINKDLAGGENVTFSFIADQKGIFQYFCVHHQPEMRGQLVVLPSVTTPHKVNTNVQVEIEPQVTKIVNHITTASPQINSVNIKQVINQLAIQIVNFGGNGSMAVNQVANQVATENGNGNVSQFVKQLAEQQASGNSQRVNQTITQVAKQVANGNEGSIVQVINQMSIQMSTNPASVIPSPEISENTAQNANQTSNQSTPSIIGSNETTATTNTNSTTSTSSSNPLDFLRNLFGMK